MSEEKRQEADKIVKDFLEKLKGQPYEFCWLVTALLRDELEQKCFVIP